MAPKKYIVVASPGIGGAEKRFFDLYCALSDEDPLLHFVVPSSLGAALGVQHASPAAKRNVISLPLAKWSILRFVLALYPVIRMAPRGSVFHYPLNPVFFLHAFRGHRLSMSICDCSRAPGLRPGNKGALLQHFAMRVAHTVDILSPSVHAALIHRDRRHSPTRLSLTPLGTFVNSSEYRPLAKRRDVVLMGRLEESKGVQDFIDVLPLVWDCVKGVKTFNDTRFLICGDGRLAAAVTKQVEHLRRSAIPVSFLGMVDARDTLGRARVVLSLQRHTNFPSRVVGEALLCGCSVLIRNTGDSAAFGRMTGISYLKAELAAVEIGERLTEILALTDETSDAYAHQIRLDALARCSSVSYVEYFRSILSPDPRASVLSHAQGPGSRL